MRTITIAAIFLACHAPARTPTPPQGGDACDSLAYVFFLIAENKDRGKTREEQIGMVRAGVDNPFATRPDATLQSLLGVVDLVYERPDESADEIRTSVLEACSVNEKGQAVLVRRRP